MRTRVLILAIVAETTVMTPASTFIRPGFMRFKDLYQIRGRLRPLLPPGQHPNSPTYTALGVVKDNKGNICKLVP